MARTITVRLNDEFEKIIEDIGDYLSTYDYEHLSICREYTDSEIVRMALQKLDSEIRNKRLGSNN